MQINRFISFTMLFLITEFSDVVLHCLKKKSVGSCTVRALVQCLMKLNRKFRFMKIFLKCSSSVLELSIPK